MCTCISDLEQRIKTECQKDFKKSIVEVLAANKTLVLPKAKTILVVPFGITLEGQKKKEFVNVANSYCPFCGEKIE